MKPSRKPAGTLLFPRARLKARKRSQITCVSTFQQGRALFAALISSAQHVRNTFEQPSMLICPVNIVLLDSSLDSDVSSPSDTRSWVCSPSSKAAKRKSQGANLPFDFSRSSFSSEVSSSLSRTLRYWRETPIFAAREDRVKAAVPRGRPLYPSFHAIPSRMSVASLCAETERSVCVIRLRIRPVVGSMVVSPERDDAMSRANNILASKNTLLVAGVRTLR